MNRLKQLREEKKESLSETSANLQIPYQTYRNYEIGKREPRIELWYKFADYFNVPISFLIGANEVSGDMVSIHKSEYERLLSIESQMKTIQELLK